MECFAPNGASPFDGAILYKGAFLGQGERLVLRSLSKWEIEEWESGVEPIDPERVIDLAPAAKPVPVVEDPVDLVDEAKVYTDPVDPVDEAEVG